MNRIPLIGGSQELPSRIKTLLAGCRIEQPTVLPLFDGREALDYLTLELPELVFINFPSSSTDAYDLLDEIMRDPWLIHGGIIALCEDDDVMERLEELRGANLVVMLLPESLERQLPLVLDIIHANRRILFQREIGTDLVREISGQFKLGNDPLEARCYTNLVCNFLYNANRIDAQTKEALSLAMYELLVNAIEHGNCGITYEEKTHWLRENTSIGGLIEQRQTDPVIAGRRVVFEYSITPTASSFLVADEGEGFNWRKMADATTSDNLLAMHGRGILMTRAVTASLNYNEKGNEVRFEIAHHTDEASTTPGLLEGMESREIEAGETIFAEGDRGDFLYYIAKGRYDVIVGERAVATLSPDDIFMGEMSFLLNNRRSASVRAATSGKLIEISRAEFVDAVKRHPHYALLLSRLLAQRIERANRQLR